MKFTAGEYEIPDGYEARIEDGKIIVTKCPTKSEKFRRYLLDLCNDALDDDSGFVLSVDTTSKLKTRLEEHEEPEDKGEISDGYHTFNELYRYRMLYNVAFFNMLPKDMVHKSKKHSDGEDCFGGGWFIVVANLPTGQICHYTDIKYWDLFNIPEKEVADEWDGHTPQEAADRLEKYLGMREELSNWTEEDDENLENVIAYLSEFRSDGYETAAAAIDWVKKLSEKIKNSK